MKDLHDSRGNHIANFVDDQLYSTSGRNIGHYLRNEKIFIDMHGKYFGEIVNDNRLLYNKNSNHKFVNYGVYGNYGNIGSYGNYGNIGSCGIYAGYEDVDIEND